MDLMQDFRRDVVRILSRQVSRKLAEEGIEKPPENIGSDLAYPCFSLAKHRKKNPAEIAREISGKLKPSGLVGKVNFYGPYINFYVDWKRAAGTLLKAISRDGDGYGHAKPAGRNVMIEYSAPNTNKPMHLGHLRNCAMGLAVSNMLEAAGSRVVRANLYSDRGAHICKSMLAYKLWGRGRKPDVKQDHFVGRFYVLFEKKKTESLEKDVQEMLRKWEAGDRETRALWKKLNGWAIKGFKETYKRFGSDFDEEFRESDFWDKSGPLIERGLKNGLFRKDKEGSVFADLEKHGLGRKVITRSDGTSIYITNDLALTPRKFSMFRLKSSIWVVGSEQDTYFRQLFSIFELLGFSWAGSCRHLSYGLVFLPEGKMKSREGKVVDADDMMDRMQALAGKEIRKRDVSIGRKELEKRSLQIGLAALKYFLLKMDVVKDIHFNPEESMSFEGDTGPYIQYSYARAMSILRKARGRAVAFDSTVLGREKEVALLKQLADFPGTVQRAAKDMRPHYMAGYALDLATKFNEFYQAIPVLRADRKARPARLALVSATAAVLKNALGLLGIDAPDRM